MTTPGGVPNLPAGGMTIETLAAKTQDMTQPAMRARAAERMPSIFDSSSGGNALSDLTPFGILTQLFAGFNSQVANGDPNDIQGPEDLPALLWAFIESLPVVGQFVDLVQAILGDYEGDDETFLAIQDIFTPIREVVERFADLLSGLGESTVGALVLRLLGIESTANTADSNATTGLGNWTSWLTGGSWANISASVADFLGTKSTANTASSNASTALGNFTSLISGAGESTLAAVASAIGSAKSNFTSLLSGMSVGSIGSLVSDLLGTKSTANTADTNATTGLGNWTSALSGSGDANAGALGSSLSTAKSNASTAIGNFTTLFSNFSVANLAAWSADLLGTKSTASTAGSNATTALGNFTSILSGLSLGSIGAWVSDLLGTKSTATTAGSNATTALANASSASSTANTVATNLQSTWNKLVDAFTGGSGSSGQTETTAATAAAVVTNTANAANAAGLAAQATLAGQETSTPTGGNSATQTFTGADGASISGWTTGPTSGDICIRTDSGTGMGIKAGNAAGRYWARYDTTQFATNDQSMSAVFSRSASDNSLQTTLLIRTTSALANGAYCHFESDIVRIGYFTFSGGTWTWNQLATQAVTLAAGDRVTFRCEGLVYYVIVNGVQVLSFNNTGNNVTQGASNRYCAVVMERSQPFGFDMSSLRLASFSMADFKGSVVSSISWNLSRASTTAVTLAVSQGAYAALPTFFTSQDYANGMGSITLGTGVVTIATTGDYRIGAGVQANCLSSNTTCEITVPWMLYKNGTLLRGPLAAGTEVTVPLAAGDTVSIGVSASWTGSPTVTRVASSSDFGMKYNITGLRGFSSFWGTLVEV